jgi:hypothetical protein
MALCWVERSETDRGHDRERVEAAIRGTPILHHGTRLGIAGRVVDDGHRVR